MNVRHGFRILGHVSNERRIVNARAVLAGYAACHPNAQVEREAYLSAFDYGDDFRAHAARTGSVRGFAGACSSQFLWWDVDREGQPEIALRDTRALCLFLIERYRLSDNELLVFFSGGKGYHVGLPTCLWEPEPSGHYHNTASALAHGVSANVPGGRVAIDASIYSIVQPFRAPNSKHARTGLHKRLLSMKELMGMDAPAIAAQAVRPSPFDLPAPDRRCEQLARDWSDADAQVAEENLAMKQLRAAERSTGGRTKLNALTLEFIKHGAPRGGPGASPEAGRHRRLFAAAVDLAELGCPAVLGHALLMPAALDSGLAPSDAAGQIDKGLKYRSPKHE